MELQFPVCCRGGLELGAACCRGVGVGTGGSLLSGCGGWNWGQPVVGVGWNWGQPIAGVWGLELGAACCRGVGAGTGGSLL